MRLKEINFVASLEGKNFEMETILVDFNKTLGPGKHKIEETIHLKKPMLWWPWDLGDPNLYKARISIKEGDGKS